MLLDEAQILTVMEKRRSFKQLKYIVYYLLELYHKKNALRNVKPQPKWWLKSVPFSRPYAGPKDLNSRDAKKALLKIIKSYLTYNGTNMIFRQVYSSALRIRELDGPKQISAKFSDINCAGASKSTIIKNKNASKPTVKTVPKKKANVVINNKKAALKILNKKISTQRLDNEVRGKKQNVKQLPKTNSTNKKASCSKRRTLLPPDKIKFKNKVQDNKLFIKESDLQQLIPCTSVNLFDVVKYGPVINTKEEFLQQLNLLQKDVLWKLSFLKYKKKLRNAEKDFVKSSANLHTAWPRLDNKNDNKNAENSKSNQSDTSVPVISLTNVKTVNQQVMDEIVVNPPPPPVKLNSSQSIASNKTSLQKTKKSPSPKSVKKPPPLSSKTNNNIPKKSTNAAKKLSPRKTSKKSLSSTISTISKKSPSKIKASLSNSSKKLSKKPLPTSPAQGISASSKKGSSETLALTNKINLKLKQLIIKKKKLELSQKARKSNKKRTKAKRSIIKIKWPVAKKSPVIKIS